MLYTNTKPSRRRGFAWRLLAVVLSATALAPAAHATDFVELADYSNSSITPTRLGNLTPGSNYIVGAINTWGSTTNPDGTPVGDHGELTHQDMDFMTFTVPVGYTLTNFIVSNGTTIGTTPRADSVFLGLASGTSFTSSYTSAASLLGWTLVSQAQLGSDILPAIGAAYVPGFPTDAQHFTGPLGAGNYTLWLYDGDAAATYSFNAVVAAVPEAGTWLMMIAGCGLIGAALRAHPRPRAATA